MLRINAMDSVVAPFVDLNKYQDDEGYILDEKPGSHVLQQQWVTLTASMWPEPTTASSRGWRISAERLPILAAVFCGAALIVCLFCAFLFYRCCIMPRKDKHYCFRKTDGTSTQIPPPIASSSSSSNYQTNHQTAVYAEQQKGSKWGYTNRIVNTTTTAPTKIWQQANWAQCKQCTGLCPPVPRSSSHPGSAQNNSGKKQRPVSQPVQLPVSTTNGEIVPKTPMPEISEFSVQHVQYASSSILDEVGAHDDHRRINEPTLKTRSLPAWVRSKPRPLSTEDDLNDLYAKVNFSKKRKNRMRNDEAAIIALSKSRSQFLHKDTDSLVDNEAVIVYDERTAL